MSMDTKIIKFKGFQLERKQFTHMVSMEPFTRVSSMNQSTQLRTHYEYRFVGCDSPYNTFCGMDSIKWIIDNADNEKVNPWFTAWKAKRESQAQ